MNKFTGRGNSRNGERNSRRRNGADNFKKFNNNRGNNSDERKSHRGADNENKSWGNGGGDFNDSEGESGLNRRNSYGNRYNRDNNRESGEDRPRNNRYNRDNNRESGEDRPRYNRFNRDNNRENDNTFDGVNSEYKRTKKYFVDPKGFGHKKYWNHDDRKKDKDEDDGRIRLNKYLSNSGMCSRREADHLIKNGEVTVNGKVVTEMGVKVYPTDIVEFNDHTIKPEKKVYLLLNKPKDYITTLRDPHARNTVMELIEGACKERICPVGRLDRNTTGVLLFTNDGDLARKLTHPSNEIQKIYHVTLDKKVSGNDLDKIVEGFDLEDGFVQADETSFNQEDDHTQVGIRIHSGRNRIVRRIFESLGYDVKKLDRVMFAGLDKKGLQRGHWRFLTEKEVGFLQMINSKTNNNSSKSEEKFDDDEEVDF